MYETGANPTKQGGLYEMNPKTQGGLFEMGKGDESNRSADLCEVQDSNVIVYSKSQQNLKKTSCWQSLCSKLCPSKSEKKVKKKPRKDGPPPVQGRTVCGKHLSEPEDLVDWPLFPDDCRSLCSKYLTEDIWNEYKHQSDDSGVTFKACIFSGCQNVDSGIGVYAGSESSYTKFNKLFDPIIEDYHGHMVSDIHISDMNQCSLNAPPFPEDESAMITSVRIRISRNLANFPLGPGVTKEQRDEIMAKVIEACTKFEGDLAGNFYPLEGMDKKSQMQLIQDHFLFKEGDRFLDACGLNRDWPSGRGIFHNREKTFLIWVNEEDHLRIISMQPGSDISAVFDRLSRAACAIEKVANFVHNDHLGYIMSCPTNLGTALRASVHIKLPKLSKDQDRLKKIADEYNVQPRNVHGMHSESTDGTYDISNKRRLGRSEKDLVQDLYNGVKAFIKAEKSIK